MSDDDSSSSDGEDIDTTGLIATRAKRSTAGNLYATLRANLDDEELQKELLAEDEEDAGDYEGSDREDDDEAMASSSDEEDAGPPKEGDQEDLEGEKQLKKAERAEARKKRKMDEAKMRLPAYKKKKVKLADDVKTEDGATVRPKKKSERSNWLPTAADMPVRQSSRSSAIANREVVHTNLKESAIRSEKQKRVMANHAERQQAKKRAELTQEERLAKAVKIEKETAREFGRWEREEAERQRIREEQLAAKRQRGIDGPLIRHWSGSVLWEGDKIKMKRMHGSRNVDEIGNEAQEAKDDDEIKTNGDTTMKDAGDKTADTTNISTPGPSTPSSNSTAQLRTTVPAQAPTCVAPQPPAPPIDVPAHQPVAWLEGIQEYAAQQPVTPVPAPSQALHMPLHQSPYAPSAPAINAVPPRPSTQYPTLAPQLPLVQPNTSQLYPPPVYHGLPPASYHEWPLQHTQAPLSPAPVVPPAPLVKEQARQSLVMLEQFENLEVAGTKKGTSKASKETTEPTAIASVLIPESYPSFTPEESRYILTKVKKSGFPPAPSKAICALTSWPAKYRDPKTGLPYADLQQYKMIQRLLAGGCQYSRTLGAYVGPDYGPLGRPAKGVPEGFGAPAPTLVLAKAKDGDVKMEGS